MLLKLLLTFLFLLFLTTTILAQTDVTDPHYRSSISSDGTIDFSSPRGIAASSQHIAISDSNNNRVLLFSNTDGDNREFLSSFGDKGAAIDRFRSPTGLAFSFDSLYVADSDNHRIVRLNVNGDSLAFQDSFGSFGAGFGQFNVPMGIVWDEATEHIIVVDTNNHRIHVLESNFDNVTVFGTFGEGAGQFRYPLYASVDEASNIWVTDSGNARVQVFSPQGDYLGFFGSRGDSNGLEFIEPSGIAVGVVNDTTEFVWVSDLERNTIQVFRITLDNLKRQANPAEFDYQYGTGGSRDGQLNAPTALAFDGENGELLAADSGNNRIQSFSAAEDPGQENESDLSEFLTSVILYTLLALFLIFLFFILRRKFMWFYASRVRKYGKPLPSRGLFSWIGDTIKISHHEIFADYGADNLFFLIWLKYMAMLIILFAIVALILLPINATGGNNELPSNHPYRTDGIEILSMSNIERGSSRLWAHFFATIINSIFVYVVLYLLYKKWLQIRSRHKSRDLAENFAVMITDLPRDGSSAFKNMNSWRDRAFKRGKTVLSKVDSTEKKGQFEIEPESDRMSSDSLFSFFKKLFPKRLYKVIRAKQTEELDKLYKKDAKWVDGLKSAQDHYGDKRPTVRHPKKYLCFGKKEDAETYYQRKVNGTRKQIAEEQKKDHPFGRVGFLIFSRIRTAVMASQSYLHHEWRVRFAPDPKAVNWQNTANHSKSRLVRRIIIIALALALIFFWTIPVTFIISLANVEELSKVDGLEWLDFTQDSDILKGFFEGFLPALILLLFMILLVPILRFLVSMEKKLSQAEESKSVFTFYFLFLLFNVILVSAIAGAVFEVLDTIIDSPGSIIKLLSSSLPTQGVFFVSYILAAVGIKALLQLLNLPKLIIGFLKRKKSKSGYDKKKAEEPIPFKHDTLYAKHMLILFIVLIFSTLQPLVVIFGLLYFLVVYIANKYVIYYMSENPWEGGAIIWPRIFTLSMIGLLLYQLTIIGVFAAADFPFIAILFALVIFSFLFLFYMKFKYDRKGYYVPLNLIKDKKDGDKAAQAYRQPTLQPVNTVEDHELEGHDVEKGRKPKYSEEDSITDADLSKTRTN